MHTYEKYLEYLHLGRRCNDKMEIGSILFELIDLFKEEPSDVNFAALIGFCVGVRNEISKTPRFQEEESYKWYKILFDKNI